MKAEYIFNLFMMAPPRKEPIDVTQNDNLMVELVAKLKNRNGTAFLPPEGAVANFIAVKPDGTGIVLRSDDPEDPKVTLADDEVRVSLPREALAVTGWIACKIAIQDNDAIASSQEFSLMCNRDLLPEDFTESEAYQSIIYYLEHLGEREAEFDDMKAQFIEAISGITEDSEVINARVDGPYSTTYDTLKLRLDAMSALLKGIVDGDFENRVSDLEDEVEDARGEFDALVDRLDDTDGRIADNAGEIDSAKVKILQLEQENKQLKKIVEDSNPTQSPRVTSTGYGVVSLPKNAANGQVSVTVKGNTETGEEGNTKSTVGAMRIKSVSADETETSTAYVVAKDEEGNIAELRSLPNGTKDEIRVSDGKLIKKIKEYVLQSSDITQVGNLTNVSYVLIAKPTDAKTYGNITSYTTDANVYLEGFTPSTFADDATKTYIMYNGTTIAIGLIVPKGIYANLTEARAALTGKTLIYQLATPIEIPIQTSGSLVSYPSGTVYIEPYVADAGIYTDKMSVLHQDLPIKALEKISKVDFETGVETELDPAQAIIAADKLSFTHPDLEAGDIVFFVYEYDRESTVGETEIEYYDSRYTIKDSVTDKFYKWNVTVADGVPSIELVEV